MVDFKDHRQRVFRRRGEPQVDTCVKEVDRFCNASIMVWVGISHYGKTNLVFINQHGLGVQGRNGRQRQQGLRARCYIDMLGHVLVPYLVVHPGMILQQDNASPHTARFTQQYLQQNNSSYHGLRIHLT